MKGTPPSSDSYIDRIRFWAASKANGSSPRSIHSSRSPTLPVTTADTSAHDPSTTPAQQQEKEQDAISNGTPLSTRDLDKHSQPVAPANANNVADKTSSDHPPPAPPPQVDGEGTLVEPEKPQRKNVAMRFYITAKSIILSSYINILLVVVPVAIAVKAANLKPGIVFALNAIAIIPLAGLLSHATESVAKRMGDTVGALMNVTFGNAVELIIFMYVYLTRDQDKKEREAFLKGIIVSIESHIMAHVSPLPLPPRVRCPIALQKNEIRIVQASLLGSILANLLLILGMCFLVGGLRFREQIYNSTVTQMSACLLSLSVMSLLLPTAFHASFTSSQEDKATNAVLKVSRGTSVILLIVYGMYLLFQLKSHAYMYESTPQHIIDEESAPGPVAHWMESSSDSDSGTSSGSESSSSNGSNTTAKRIRRALVGRRHRKSSSGSKETAEADATRSPSIAAHSASPEELHHSAIDFADDGDDEDRERGHGRSRKNSFIGVLTKRERRKHRRRREKREGKRREREAAAVANDSAGPSAAAEPKLEQDPNGPRHIDFALPDDAGVVTDSSQKRTFTLRGISSTIRPSVFMQPSPNPEPVDSKLVPRVKYGIRRTNSLPDRLDQTLPPPARVASSNLQPVRIGSAAIAERKPAEEDEENISRTTAVLLLLISTGLVAVCAEFMVDSINAVVSGGSGLSEAFIGLIILPIVGNAAEHVTAVTVASKNKMDLAIGVAVGSSIQIALFVTPFIVLLGWCMSKDMSLYFTLFETVCLFVSAFIVNFLVLDGRSNYLEGSLLCAAYVIIAVAAFFYPQVGDQSVLGGNPQATSRALMARNMVGSIVGM